MTAYYNEHDPHAAAWLRELIKGGHIAPGEVDERDIRDITPADLFGFRQCHFFAGIGGWSYALRLAGWPDDRPAWTGSCPCQPFGAAGRRGGVADERHLWPYWHWLIQQCRPGIVFGEQVTAAIKHGWLDLVQTDLESIGYTSGAIDLCAAGIGAPHIRQRMWFVAQRLADADGWIPGAEPQQPGREQRLLTESCGLGGLVHSIGTGLEGLPRDGDDRHQPGRHDAQQDRSTTKAGSVGGMADAERRSPERHGYEMGAAQEGMQGQARKQRIRHDARNGESTCRPGPTNGHWRNADWLPCRDGKARPVEPGTFPLAYGLPGRMGLLRGYGNAIVPQVAEQIIRSMIEILE